MRRDAQRMVTIALTLLMLFGGFAGVVPAPDAQQAEAAISGTLKMPVPSGPGWVIGQGYNTKPNEGGTHWNCDPVSLKDQPTRSADCRAHYQYQWSLDLARADGNTAYQPVLAPADGVIRWIDPSTGGMSIDLQDGYAFAFFHANLMPGMSAGMRITRGQRLGVLSPPGQGANGGWPHLHITMWQTNDGGNWSRNPVPFVGAYALDGVSLPNLGSNVLNQHRGTVLYSTNVEVGGGSSTPGTGSVPGIPVQASPANGTAITQANPRPNVTWQSVSGATEYQVVVNDGQITSPWQASTSWTMPALSPGQYAWQVRARNSAGQGGLTAKWLLFVNTSGTPSESPSPALPPPPAGGLRVTAQPSSGQVAATTSLTGSGFLANEQVRVTLDSPSGGTLVTATADGNGSFRAAVTIPAATRGAHSLIVKGVTSGRQAIATYMISPSLSRTPLHGAPGTAVTVTARGFGANETVRLNWKSATGPTLAETRTNAQGTATATFALPDSANGWHDYTGAGLTSGARAWGNFGIDPDLKLSASTANSGQQLTATVRGYPASRSVSLAWNKSAASSGTTLCQGNTGVTGTYSCTFTVPAGSGVFPVTATSDSTSRVLDVSVGGGTSTTITPTNGTVGSNLSISTGGFQANEQVQVRWDNGGTWLTLTANGSGAVSTQATVPYLSFGTHLLTARGLASGRQATANYAVRQSMSVSPGGGSSGTRVTMYLNGFQANQPITSYWNRTGSGSGQSVCSGTVAGNGSFSCSFMIPNGTPGTNYPITSISSTISAMVNFQMSGSVGGIEQGGGNVVSAGTYRVNTTREGLVGGTTSSGHKIVPYDRFVALPNCTTTSCPWLASGGNHELWGTRTECGDRCYVRIVNPANSSCIVAPIKDVGPWFTLDNWWDPTSQRNLNNRPSNSNVLRQGYPGAQAARDGLDVGWGRGPSGFGISNKQYEVANNAAVDIGDGSWVDLGFPMAQGYAPNLVVTMLWQSGENPTTAAQACGQTSANPGPGQNAGPGPSAPPSVAPVPSPPPVATPAPTSAPAPAPAPGTPSTQSRLSLSPLVAGAGETVLLTGSGYSPNEYVRLTWDSTSGTYLGQVRANNQGSFAVNLRTPIASAGQHQVIGRGQSSGRVAASSLLIRASVSSSPSVGVPGSNAFVSVSGFAPNETVQIRWAGVSGQQLAIFRVLSNGTGGSYIQVPRVNPGSYMVYAYGMTSRVRASGSFQITGALSLTASDGRPGSLASVQASGLPAGQFASVRWGLSGSAGSQVCSGNVSGNGTFSCSFLLPSGTQYGVTYIVTATSGGVALSTMIRFRTLSYRALSISGDSAEAEVLTADSVERDTQRAPRTIVVVEAPETDTDLDAPITAAVIADDASVSPSPSAMTEARQDRGPRDVTMNEPSVSPSAEPSAMASPRSAAVVVVEPEGTEASADATVEPDASMAPSREPRSAASDRSTATLEPSPSIEASLSAEISKAPSTAPVSDPSTEASIDSTSADLVEPSASAEASASTASEEPERRRTPARSSRSQPSTEATVEPTSSPTVEAIGIPEDGPSSEPSVSASSSVEPLESAEPEALARPSTESSPSDMPSVTENDDPSVEPSASPSVQPSAIVEAAVSPSSSPSTEPSPSIAPAPSIEPSASVAPVQVEAPLIVEQTLTFVPVADTTVLATNPDAPQAPETTPVLTQGGVDGAVTYITFAVTGVTPGTVVSATLTLTGAGTTGGPGGVVSVVPGVAVDEYGATWTTRPVASGAAIDANGVGSWLGWIEPGRQTTIDVTGTVSADGTITFVLAGDPATAAQIGSRESGTPPVLTVKTATPQ